MTENNGVVRTEQIARAKLSINSFMSSFSIEREQAFGAAASKTYAGARDIYRTAGYPPVLSVTDYLGRYQRDALAYRIVTAGPDDTWREPFSMLDGSNMEDGLSDTPFVKAWNKFVQFDTLEGDLLDDSRRSLWHYFFDVDRQCGIGQYAVMLLGFADVAPGDAQGFLLPLQPGGGGKLLYIHVANEYNSRILQEDLVRDPNNARFGLPEFYRMDFNDGFGQRRIHFSRCIHVAENGVLFGKPRLEAVYNRLIDIEKLLAASGEAGWRSITRKIIISTRDGYQLSESTVSADKVNDMIHGLRDVVELEGMDVNVVSGESIDPTGSIDNQLNMISAGTDIPKRILIGSERGQLASTQDEKHWNDNIEARRTQFVEPTIVRPFIKRMIYAGLLPMPSSGAYMLDWPSLFKTTDAEQSTTFLQYAQGISYLKDPGVERIVKQPELVKYFIRGLPADAVPNEQELAAMDAAAAQKQQDALALAQAQKQPAQVGAKMTPPKGMPQKGIAPVMNSAGDNATYIAEIRAAREEVNKMLERIHAD